MAQEVPRLPQRGNKIWLSNEQIRLIAQEVAAIMSKSQPAVQELVEIGGSEEDPAPTDNDLANRIGKVEETLGQVLESLGEIVEHLDNLPAHEEMTIEERAPAVARLGKKLTRSQGQQDERRVPPKSGNFFGIDIEAAKDKVLGKKLK